MRLVDQADDCRQNASQRDDPVIAGDDLVESGIVSPAAYLAVLLDGFADAAPCQCHCDFGQFPDPG